MFCLGGSCPAELGVVSRTGIVLGIFFLLASVFQSLAQKLCSFLKVSDDCLELAVRTGSENSPAAEEQRSLPVKSVVLLLCFLFGLGCVELVGFHLVFFFFFFTFRSLLKVLRRRLSICHTW